ncbi:MAG: redox-regulated ATPase YchF [Planctomycetota bacterium]|nr:MAG: redox-regulated ATPase YchF [Planctomycetota bacterium]REJ96696.1 MAG: redox-regulated ATPase YchF [Planctomycetota bacterium]
MKIGIVGYQGSGKSTLFEWLTEVAADPSLSHSTQSAMATVPEPRVGSLCDIYQPKKVTLAALQLVDTPGLERSHEGNASRLSLIREAGCLVHVVGAFTGADPLAEANSLAEDLLLADMDIVARRIEKLRESIKKPRPTRDQEKAELEALEPLLETLEAGTPLTEIEMTDEQQRATRSFQLLTEKPRMVIFNTADDESDPDALVNAAPEGITALAIPVGLAVELDAMEADEREEMMAELGIGQIDRDTVIRKILGESGQMLFFTAGDKEVRTWMIPQGATAVDAADGIHSDLARGFVRAETMSCDDLFRLGSEREVKAAKLMRQETKDYVIQDGDILHILANA